MLACGAMRLVLVAALVAQTLCFCACRHLTEADEDSSNHLYVSNSQAFVDALNNGVRHVAVTEHLDLSAFSKALSSASGGVAETTTTVSIQVQFVPPCALARD